MNQLITIFMALIKCELTEQELHEDIAKNITPEIIKKLYSVANRHSLTHIIASALDKKGLLEDEEILKPFLKGVFHAVKKQERTERARKALYALLEKEGFSFVPLKGTVLEKLYPSPWMRTRCDTDILVREEDLQRVKEKMVSVLGYEVKEEKYHDIWLRSPEKVDVELHFSLKEHMEELDKVLVRVWDYVEPIREGGFEYKMTPEFLLFHLFAHMSYHFKKGGCGVRSIIDIWLLQCQGGFDIDEVRTLCEEAGIWKFAQSILELANIWFEHEQHNQLSLLLEAYIIKNGTYGSRESKVMATRVEKRGKIRYIWSRMFLPREDLGILFPGLKERPYLYLYYSVKHWGKVVKKKKGKAVMAEIKLNNEMKQESIEKLEELFCQLGI